MTTNISALYGIDRNRSSGKWRSQTFTASGVWQRPAGVEVAKVLLVAGGGSGGISRFENGNNGGDSSFGGILVARGGGRGLNYDFNKYASSPEISGYPGGIGTGFPTYYTYSDPGGYSYEGMPVGAKSWRIFTTLSNTAPGGIPGISSAFGSSGGGGGSYAYIGVPTPTKSAGGNVIGFGTGGAAPCGGGGSYGNGGAGGSTAGSAGSFGGGGGGAAAGGGGGGGEIVLREVPVSSDIAIIIGAGGSSVTRTINGIYHVSGAGGNGLCIVYWQE